MKSKNYINVKYNNLTIISVFLKNNRKYCICQCDCGKLKEFRIDSVTTGKVISCCRKKDKFLGKNNPNYAGVEELSGAFYGKLKAAANYRKLEFNISKNFLWELYIKQNKKCALSGMELYFPKGSLFITGNISLDRINSKLGYTENNVQWLHKDINMMKNIYSNEYLLEVVKKIYEYKINGELNDS